ncbi:hypothetical protein N1I87_15555 [Bacillus sp. FSL W8-0102]|uniref:hypothetical protein n=1 Tax=Bacillus sp. FSL W8-0102 TaxID=2978205 RepID=UPI0030F757EB
MDNMMLSKLRKDAVCNPFIIQKGFQLSKVILIPDIILEEASKNLPDEKAFEKYYYELFRILSTEHEIYVADLQIIFELLRDMIGTKEAAFNILKNISLEAVRTNQTIRDSSELPSTYQPYGLIEVGASRVIPSNDRKLTELTLSFRKLLFFMLISVIPHF